MAVGFFSGRPWSAVRAVFVAAHLARDEQEAREREVRRDAALVLSLAVLLAGKEQARRDVAEHLQRVARGENGAAPPGTTLEDLHEMERAAFLDLDPLWTGATPDHNEEEE